MPKFMLKCSLSAFAILFAAATIDVAQATGNKRKQRSGSGQMMRLGGPTNGAAATNGGFVDRTGGPTLRSSGDIERFFRQQSGSRGPG
jgi:hypothetical protein